MINKLLGQDIADLKERENFLIDNTEGDDFQFEKEHEFLWCPLETMSEDEIIKL